MTHLPTISPLSGIMSIWCAWCQKPLGQKPCDPALDGQKSHTACIECAAKVAHSELCERIVRADRLALTEIVLTELPLVENDDYRLVLRQMAQIRFEKLRR